MSRRRNNVELESACADGCAGDCSYGPDAPGRTAGGRGAVLYRRAGLRLTLREGRVG